MTEVGCCSPTRGEALGLAAGPEPWLSVLPLYAELQLGEADHLVEHLDGGVPDRRLATCPGLYEAMLARPLPCDAHERKRLCAFAARFAELCDELKAAGIPETIRQLAVVPLPPRLRTYCSRLEIARRRRRENDLGVVVAGHARDAGPGETDYRVDVRRSGQLTTELDQLTKTRGLILSRGVEGTKLARVDDHLIELARLARNRLEVGLGVRSGRRRRLMFKAALDRVQQRGGTKRLAQVSIGAGGVGRAGIGIGMETAEHENDRLFVHSRRLDPSAHGQPVELGHPHVEQDQIWSLAQSNRHRGRAIDGLENVVGWT